MRGVGLGAASGLWGGRKGSGSGQGEASRAWLGVARHGGVWQGVAGCRRVWRGMAGRGRAWRGVWQGVAGGVAPACAERPGLGKLRLFLERNCLRTW